MTSGGKKNRDFADGHLLEKGGRVVMALTITRENNFEGTGDPE